MTFETANHMEGNKLHHLLFRVIFFKLCLLWHSFKLLKRMYYAVTQPPTAACSCLELRLNWYVDTEEEN